MLMLNRCSICKAIAMALQWSEYLDFVLQSTTEDAHSHPRFPCGSLLVDLMCQTILLGSRGHLRCACETFVNTVKMHPKMSTIACVM